MKKRIVAFLLTLAMLVGLVPQMMLAALADELAAAYTLENDFIRVSVSKKNGGFTVATREGDRLKKSDNNKKLLYHDGEYDTSFVTFRVTDAGGRHEGLSFRRQICGQQCRRGDAGTGGRRDQSRLVGRRSDLHRDGGACRCRLE